MLYSIYIAISLTSPVSLRHVVYVFIGHTSFKGLWLISLFMFPIVNKYKFSIASSFFVNDPIKGNASRIIAKGTFKLLRKVLCNESSIDFMPKLKGLENWVVSCPSQTNA